MKKILFVLIIVPFHFAIGQNSPDSLARNFISLLNQEKFVEASKQFDETVAAKIGVEQVGQIWQSLTLQVGSFQEIVGVKVQQKENLSRTISLCKFEKAYIDIQLVFNEAGKIGGLFFRPAESPEKPAYILPSYVVTDSYEETNFKIQTPFGDLKAIYTAPKKIQNPPVIVLVHGSGPNDEDETFGPNKLFVDLAGGLASKGIGTIRYVKRSKAYPASFDENATVRDEVVNDALTAIEKAAEFSNGSIYVLGHSLGGMMTPLIIQENDQLKGGIIFAGNSRPLEDLMMEQVEYILQNNAANGQEESYADIKSAAQKLKDRAFNEGTPKEELLNIPPSYWIDLLKYDQAKTAKKLKTPLLVLQGERDYQVTMKDFEGWKEVLKKRAVFKSYPALNHMFFAGEGLCLPDEYTTKGNVPEYVIDDIRKWIESL